MQVNRLQDNAIVLAGRIPGREAGRGFMVIRGDDKAAPARRTRPVEAAVLRYSRPCRQIQILNPGYYFRFFPSLTPRPAPFSPVKIAALSRPTRPQNDRDLPVGHVRSQKLIFPRSASPRLRAAPRARNRPHRPCGRHHRRRGASGPDRPSGEFDRSVVSTRSRASPDRSAHVR